MGEKLTKEELLAKKAEARAKKDHEKLRKQQLKLLPLESAEETNPKVALYNEIVRAAWTYYEGDVEHHVDPSEVGKIWNYVMHDYPELFWIAGISYTQNTFKLSYRCLDKNGNFDREQVETKREQLRKAAKKFTAGITKRTPPYEALLTIYRRIILTLDYDGVRLNNDNETIGDTRNDDVLRSLYSALVEHKVVCAGYAVAMQYLLQSVGISCGYVSSDSCSHGSHAFNALKIGKYCYYLDATWGDWSNTSTGGQYKDDIFYDYVCVPFKEFIMTSSDLVPLHTPNSGLYPKSERFDCITHEYFRQIGAYLTVYEEDKMVEIFANAVNRYNSQEMGRFSVHFRCVNTSFRDYVLKKILEPSTFQRIITKAIAKCGKNGKKAKKLFNSKFVGSVSSKDVPTAYLIWDNPLKK